MTAVGQSSLLTGLETTTPTPTLEPTAFALSKGLAVLWSDPAADTRATGILFSAYDASHASVRVFHAAVAFKWGPRWSLAYAGLELRDLFDTSLTNQDPTLSALRARAGWGQLDATFRLPRLTAAIGWGIAFDENVGVMQSSTLVRTHLRAYPLQSEVLAVGLQLTRSAGGSVPTHPAGRQAMDVTISQPIGSSLLSITGAASHGRLWRYSETGSGYGLAVQLTILSQLDLGAGLGLYSTTYGSSQSEWYRSATAALRVGALRLGTRYVSTRLGVGSGLGLSLAYGH